MPRIKAYKSAGTIIPVSDAKLVTAFSCPWTNKIFGTKSSYVKHLRELRTTRMHRRIREMAWNRKLMDLWSQPTFESVINWIEVNPDFMFDNAMKHGWPRRIDEKKRKDFWIKITYLNIEWYDSVSNTHSCPRGGVTNWGGREYWPDKTPKPTGYPGWHGRIEYQLSHDIGFDTASMKSLGIHTGTGGGTSKNVYGFDVKFFDADWAGISEATRNSRVLDVLSDDHRSYRIKYGTPNYFRL